MCMCVCFVLTSMPVFVCIHYSCIIYHTVYIILMSIYVFIILTYMYIHIYTYVCMYVYNVIPA